MTELFCPICGHNVDGYEGLVACTNDPDCPLGCAMYPLDAWKAMSERIARLIKANPAPSTRMADVRLWTWTDESNRNPNVYAVRYCGTEMFTTNSANAAKSRCDELNLAATVTLPDAKKCEADRGIDWYAAYERMAHNRNELWAKLKAVEAALAHKEGK